MYLNKNLAKKTRGNCMAHQIDPRGAVAVHCHVSSWHPSCIVPPQGLFGVAEEPKESSPLLLKWAQRML